MGVPEPAGRSRMLRQLGSSQGELVALDREVAVDVPHPVAEPAPQPLDDVVDRVAGRARVAAVLDQRHLGAGGAQDVIPGHVDGSVERVPPASSHRSLLVRSARSS